MENKTLIIVSVIAVLLIGTVVAVNLSGSGVTGKAVGDVTYYCWGASITDHTISTSTTKPYSWYTQQNWSSVGCYDAPNCNNWCTSKGFASGVVGSDAQQCICSLAPSCTETDDGADPSSAASCSDSEGVHSDSCAGNVLSEYVCSDAKCSKHQLDCAVLYGDICNVGRCESPDYSSCTDSDGIEIYTKGMVEYEGFFNVTDYCQNMYGGPLPLNSCSSSDDSYECGVREFQCSGHFFATCPYGCEDGACIASGGSGGGGGGGGNASASFSSCVLINVGTGFSTGNEMCNTKFTDKTCVFVEENTITDVLDSTDTNCNGKRQLLQSESRILSCSDNLEYAWEVCSRDIGPELVEPFSGDKIVTKGNSALCC